MYIMLEGPDFSGKSTIVSALRQHFGEPEIVREPGGTELAEWVRTLLHSGATTGKPEVEIHLMMAARADLLATLVAPALAADKVVISDRGYPSTYVFQCCDAAFTKLWKLHVATLSIKPDLIVYLDMDYDTYVRRKQLRGTEDAMDLRVKGRADYEAIRMRYLDIAAQTSGLVLDARSSTECNCRLILEKLCV